MTCMQGSNAAHAGLLQIPGQVSIVVEPPSCSLEQGSPLLDVQVDEDY